MTPDTDKARQEAERQIGEFVCTASLDGVIRKWAGDRLALTHAQKEIVRLTETIDEYELRYASWDFQLWLEITLKQARQEIADLKAKLGEAVKGIEEVLNVENVEMKIRGDLRESLTSTLEKLK